MARSRTPATPAAKPAPHGTHWLDPRAPYLLPLLAVIATRLWFARVIPTANEDAYITFRYAANWAEGLGPVFNAGERVMGFTSPLWTALLALGMRLGAEPVALARQLATVADVALVLAGAALLERHASRGAAWLFAAFWACFPYFAAVTVSGLETGVVVALAVCAAWAMERSGLAAGVLLGLLALSRPEGFAVAVVMGVWASPRARLVGGAIALAGLAWLTLQFGSPVPQSLLAKASLYGTPGPWAGRHWWDWALPVVFDADPASSETGNLRLVSALLFAGLVAGLPEIWRQRRTPLAAAAAGLLAVWVAYTVLGVAFFFWYLVLPLGACSLVAATGLARLARGPVLAVAFVLAVAGLWVVTPRLYINRAAIESTIFRTMGDLLEKHGKPGEKVMLEPIGMIGWQNRRLVVLDEVGLVSPAIAHRRREGPGWYADLVSRERPEWLLSRRGVLLRNAAFAGAGQPFRSDEERDRTLADYTVAAAQDTSIGDAAWLVLRRAPGR
jgi:hypothetical protein